jgi:hypothetical protein
LKNIQQEKFFFVARLVPPFYVNLRPDFCGPRPLLHKWQKGYCKTPDIHVVKSIITAKITPKVISTADPADEVAASTDG